MGDSISVYMQVYRQKRAVFEALKSFRTHYRQVPITVVSDNGDDFSKMCQVFNARYVHASTRTHAGPELRTGNPTTIEGNYEYLKRIYDHCTSSDTDWVVLLMSGTRTIRRIRSFPQTAIAGARTNPFSPALTNHLIEKFGNKLYAYGCSGGGIFRRTAYIEAYEGKKKLEDYVRFDSGVALYHDLAFGLLFLINGFGYSVWDEVSEIFHEAAPIVRDSAFDHGYKYWYDKEWDDRLLDDIDPQWQVDR